MLDHSLGQVPILSVFGNMQPLPKENPSVLGPLQATACTSLLLTQMLDPPTACSPCTRCALVGLTASANFAEKKNAKQTQNPRTMMKHTNLQEMHPPRLLHQYCMHTNT